MNSLVEQAVQAGLHDLAMKQAQRRAADEQYALVVSALHDGLHFNLRELLVLPTNAVPRDAMQRHLTGQFCTFGDIQQGGYDCTIGDAMRAILVPDGLAMRTGFGDSQSVFAFVNRPQNSIIVRTGNRYSESKLGETACYSALGVKDAVADFVARVCKQVNYAELARCRHGERA